MTNKEAILKRVSTGIIGLDAIMDGGIREGTVLMVAGASGTGKSTFASQFLLHGLENGESALYITLEEKPEQLIKEARLMGWDIEEYYANGQLSFFHTSGRDFGEIIEKELSASLQKRDKTKKTRIAIDPLTPLLWATREDIIRRELLTKLFEMLKEVGPVVVTVEEHTTPGEIFGKEILVPIYLSDAAIHLKYQPLGGAFNRTLEIMKMRGSRHGEEVYPYFFVHGIGMIGRSAPITITPKK
ncbi:MAG: RAD55 family ATPase, partial [Methanosarcinales archaeon]